MNHSTDTHVTNALNLFHSLSYCIQLKPKKIAMNAFFLLCTAIYFLGSSAQN